MPNRLTCSKRQGLGASSTGKEIYADEGKEDFPQTCDFYAAKRSGKKTCVWDLRGLGVGSRIEDSVIMDTLNHPPNPKP